jgi:mycothiol synthase
MTGLMWRPAAAADAAGVADLFRVSEQRVPVGLETELAEVEARLSRPRLDLDADTLAGVDADGRLLAYAEAGDMGVGQGQARIRLTSAVHPDLGEDVTGMTFDWLLTRAGRLLAQRYPDLPGVLGARCGAADQARLGLLTGAGFEVARWHRDLERGVAQPLPAPARPLPHDIAIVPYDLRYDEATRIAHNDAYADDPAALLPDAQSWPQHATGLANFRPDASFLALAGTAPGQQIAGFLFSLEQHGSAGSGQGSLHCLGTRKPWRRQGLATALISRALAAFQRIGFSAARLEVDSTNSAALALYGRLGFTDSGRGYAMLVKEQARPAGER